MKEITITITAADSYVIQCALKVAAAARGTKENKAIYSGCYKRFTKAAEEARKDLGR